MEIVQILNTLSRRRAWIAVAVLVAVFVGLNAGYHVGFKPPSLKSRAFQVGSASTQVLLDSSQSSLVNLNRTLEPLSTRAAVFASFMQSGPLTAAIAQEAGIRPGRLSTAGPASGPGDQSAEVDAEQRANQLVSEAKIYRLRFDAGAEKSSLPIISMYATAPSAKEAEKLANAAATALRNYVTETAGSSGAPVSERLVAQQITTPKGGVIAHNVAKKTVVGTALFVLAGLLVLIVVISGVLESWRLDRSRRQFAGMPDPDADAPHTATDNGHAPDAARGRVST